MYYQLSRLHTMRNYEFMYSIKSRDITHSIALFYNDSKNQFLNLKKLKPFEIININATKVF